MSIVIYQTIPLQAVIDPVIYQSYLEIGWYRVQQHLMTTDFIVNEGLGNHATEEDLPENRRIKIMLRDKELVPVFWLRINCAKIGSLPRHPKSSYIQNNFDVKILPFAYSDELEKLYASYYLSVDFNASPTLAEYLFDESGNNFFSSSMITIRDNGKLIGFGLFDTTNVSVIGIINVYDPAYKKLSPGKWLIRKKLEWALLNNKAFYYPGYFSTRVSKFDYKLDIAPNATEIWLRNQETWVSAQDTDVDLLEANLLQNLVIMNRNTGD